MSNEHSISQFARVSLVICFSLALTFLHSLILYYKFEYDSVVTFTFFSLFPIALLIHAPAIHTEMEKDPEKERARIRGIRDCISLFLLSCIYSLYIYEEHWLDKLISAFSVGFAYFMFSIWFKIFKN